MSLKEIVVISGKGGTGKTSVLAAFAAFADKPVLCDTDVDAANLHLLLDPEVLTTEEFSGSSQAFIQDEECLQCGMCRDLCRFSAISEQYRVDPLSCEGCGVCAVFCPTEAIHLTPRISGTWYRSETRFGPMVHARLGIAEENSGKLVSLIRKQAQEVALEQGRTLIITDGPPGIGCPVIASITGATALLIVAEPSTSGLHDMERVAGLAAHFNLPAYVCINKADLNPEVTAITAEQAERLGLPVVGRIPFSPLFTEAMVAGLTVPEFAANSAINHALLSIWKNLLAAIESSESAVAITL